MKENDPHSAKKKKFIQLPIYRGGKKAFKDFVAQNLVYPEEALKNGIGGLVHVEYEVNHLGEISEIKIKKGIGFGCDEETIRIISLMKYEPVRNRGLRITSKMKARIQFILPAPPPVEIPAVTVNINYAITEKKGLVKEPTKSYSYTINMG